MIMLNQIDKANSAHTIFPNSAIRGFRSLLVCNSFKSFPRISAFVKSAMSPFCHLYDYSVAPILCVPCILPFLEITVYALDADGYQVLPRCTECVADSMRDGYSYSSSLWRPFRDFLIFLGVVVCGSLSSS